MDANLNEFKIEVTCFYNWEEWLFIIELICPKIASFSEWKTWYYRSSDRENLPSYYSFLLEKILNTQENLQLAIKFLESILSRNPKLNPLAVLATKQFLSHYLALKYDKKSLPSLHQTILLDIIRSTSQLSDIYQDSHRMNKSIKSVLDSINMKESHFISEIRHMATHKQLPSLLLTSKSVEYLLLFFLENYWLKIYQKLQKEIPNDNNKRLYQENFEFLDEIKEKKMGKVFSNKNISFFKKNIQKLIEDLLRKEDLKGIEDILKDFKGNLKKNKFKCGIFFSEILKNFINSCLKMEKTDVTHLKNMIVKIMEFKEKRFVGKLFRFPFIKYKILRMISLMTVNHDFKEILEGFFKRFYAKNDKNMTFFKDFEESFKEETNNQEEKAFTSEEIKGFLDKNLNILN